MFSNLVRIKTFATGSIESLIFATCQSPKLSQVGPDAAKVKLENKNSGAKNVLEYCCIPSLLSMAQLVKCSWFVPQGTLGLPRRRAQKAAFGTASAVH